MSKSVNATTLKAMLNDGGELALLDVREEGQFGITPCSTPSCRTAC